MTNTTFKSLIIVNLLLLIISAYFITTRFFTKKDEMVYIDTPRLLSKYKGMEDARKELEQKSKEIQSNVDTLGMELEASVKKYEKERTTLSKKEQQLSEELLRNKQQQYMQYQQAMQQKMSEEDKKLQTKVLNEVNAFIKEYGKRKGYRFIMGATAAGNLVYADEAYDVTEEVLNGLNIQYIQQ